MSHPLVANIHRGQRYDVYVGRPRTGQSERSAPWGNPFILGVDGNHDQVIQKFREVPAAQRRADAPAAGGEGQGARMLLRAAAVPRGCPGRAGQWGRSTKGNRVCLGRNDR